jgi:fumarate reductase subunit C
MWKNYMKGEGTIVFIIAFVIFLTATLAYTELPPGNAISDAMSIDPTTQ